MVPVNFYVLENLPRTISGKVDRMALPWLEGNRANLSSPYQPPRNTMESMMIDLWSQLLNEPQIGILDRFLEVGGDSLIAAQIMAQVSDQLGIDLPLGVLFDANVRELCEWLVSKSQQG
jgi:acyl carrier protein